MKPGDGIDPANYTGAGDSEYFKKQFQKQQKRNAKKAASEAQLQSNVKVALGVVVVAAAGLFLYSSDQFLLRLIRDRSPLCLSLSVLLCVYKIYLCVPVCLCPCVCVCV